MYEGYSMTVTSRTDIPRGGQQHSSDSNYRTMPNVPSSHKRVHDLWGRRKVHRRPTTYEQLIAMCLSNAMGVEFPRRRRVIFSCKERLTFLLFHTKHIK